MRSLLITIESGFLILALRYEIGFHSCSFIGHKSTMETFYPYRLFHQNSLSQALCIDAINTITIGNLCI